MEDDLADQLEALANEAAQLVKNLEHYWEEDGLSGLHLFVDPNQFQALDRMFHEAYEFVARCQDLDELVEQLRTA